MDNFRDSYFKVNWDLTTNPLKGIYRGKQYDTGRGFVVTVINGEQVVEPTTEVLRLKWEKPDNTTGYVNATIVDGKFIVENIDQMFTVQGIVRADFELSVGGKFVASTTFHVNVEKAVAVDSIESSSDFTALHSALLDVGTVQDSLDGYVDAESVRVANESIRIDNESDREAAEGLRVSAETDREAAEALRQTGYATMDEAIALKADLSEIEAARGTEPTLGARLDSTDAQLNNMTQDFTQHKLDYAEDIGTVANLTTTSKEVVGAVNELDEAIALKADLSEIEAARGTEPTLGARLDSTDAQLNDMTQDFTQHKLDYVEDKKEIKKDISTLKQIAHYDEVLEEYIGLDQFWNSLRNGKVYTTEFYQFDVSPSPSGVKKDDNEGLICEPSTNTERGRNDYEKIGLFMSIDVNAYVDENDDYHVIAIKGDGRFKSDGSMGDVYVMSMPGYIKRYKDEEVWSISYSDAMHPGFEVIDEAVKPDGTIRPYLLHAKYIAGRNPHENNNLASISGVPAEHVGMSHNGQIAEFKEKGIQYSGKTSHDDFYAQLMFWLKYATTHSQSVMYGAASGYDLQYSNLVSEVGVKRVIVTNSQANNLLVGSTVSIGDYGDGEISASRSLAQNSNLADRVNIIDIADLGDGNSAVYVDSEVEFKTSLTTTITTYPWNSGSCDNVLGQDGSPYDNLSGKEPFIINGIEMMVGGYEVLQNLIIHNNSDDDRTDVYVNYDCHTYSTSPTADYDLAGQLVSTGNVWRYGSKLSIPDNHPSVMLITEAEASSTTGFADGIYTNPPSSGSPRAWHSLGNLTGGAGAGLRYLFANYSLGISYWYILGRLSATGRSRRRAGVN